MSVSGEDMRGKVQVTDLGICVIAVAPQPCLVSALQRDTFARREGILVPELVVIVAHIAVAVLLIALVLVVLSF